MGRLSLFLLAAVLGACSSEGEAPGPPVRDGEPSPTREVSVEDLLRRGEDCLQEAFVVLGAALVHEEKARCARDAFARVVARRPHEADAWYQLGFAHEYLGEDEEALAAYARAAREASRHGEAVLARGRLLARMGRGEEAARVLAPLDTAEALYEKGKLARKAGDMGSARDLFRAAVGRDPAYAEAWLNLARTSWRLEDEAAAREAEERFRRLEEEGLTLDRLRTVARARPSDSQVWLELGRAWLRRGRPREAALALGHARDTADREPERLQAELLLGRALMERGDYVPAAELLGRLARARPRDANIRLYLAAALRESGRAEEALHELEGLNEIQPGNPYVLQNLAILSRETGDLRAAASYAAQARRAARGVE